jgi:polyphosphate kinase
VKADDKKRARLNCITHLLSLIPYGEIPFDAADIPKPKKRPEDAPEAPMFRNFVPEIIERLDVS